MRNLPALLIILDGFGLRKDPKANAIARAKTPVMDKLFKKGNHTQLKAHGKAVGLPNDQMGNSEVGHMNIGAGRIVYQELTRINQAIEDGSLNQNKTLQSLIEYAKEKQSYVHLMGLTSEGGVHSELSHGKALIKIFAQNGLNVAYHAFMDGRDVPPDSGIENIKDLEKFCTDVSHSYNVDVHIATVSGRYYAMDRDKRWDRIELAYNAITKGEGNHYDSAIEAVEQSYSQGVYDEFIKPSVIGKHNFDPDDVVMFFNFRADRARQLTEAFTDKDFNQFERDKFLDVPFVTLTEYDESFTVPVVFEKIFPEHVLADVLSEQGLKQLHTAETEKYAHVTFFLNGGKEEPKPGEMRRLIKSPDVATYDLKPEMSAIEVTEKLLDSIENKEADVFIVNFANCDMVGHTGVLSAAIQAVECVDTCVGKLIDKVTEQNGVVLITADHGNAEQMVDYDAQGGTKPHTSHTLSPVPFIIEPVLESTKVDTDYKGKLCDIAPTLLDVIGVEKPKNWTGRSLLKH